LHLYGFLQLVVMLISQLAFYTVIWLGVIHITRFVRRRLRGTSINSVQRTGEDARR
jgi:hypothetical protein